MPKDSRGPTVFLDIETIPEQGAGAIDRAKSRVKVPGNYSKQETIDAYVAENTRKEWLRTSLDPNYGHIVAIGVTVRHGPDTERSNRYAPVNVFTAGALSGKNAKAFDFVAFERKLLVHFWGHLSAQVLGSPLFVNHYLTTFDMPFLIKRSIINRVRVPFDIPINPKLWANDMFDTRVEWTGDRNTHIKLDALARVLRVGDPEKYNEHEGSDVWGLVESGNIKELGKYCRRDVELVRDMYDVMTGQWEGKGEREGEDG